MFSWYLNRALELHNDMITLLLFKIIARLLITMFVFSWIMRCFYMYFSTSSTDANRIYLYLSFPLSLSLHNWHYFSRPIQRPHSEHCLSKILSGQTISVWSKVFNCVCDVGTAVVTVRYTCTLPVTYNVGCMAHMYM